MLFDQCSPAKKRQKRTKTAKKTAENFCWGTLLFDGNNGIISLELNGIPAAQLPRASLVASFVNDISRLSPVSITSIGTGILSGFNSFANGCIRHVAVNEDFYDI